EFRRVLFRSRPLDERPFYQCNQDLAVTALVATELAILVEATFTALPALVERTVTAGAAILVERTIAAGRTGGGIAAGRHLCVAGDHQRTLANTGFLDHFQYIGGHALGQVDGGEVISDIDVADETALDVRFVGDSAHDLARLDTVMGTHV